MRAHETTDSESDDVDPQRGRQSRSGWWRAAALLTTLLAFGLLTRQASGVDFSRLLADADPARLAVAIGVSLVPLVGATAALLALSPVRLPLLPAAAVQVATSFANIVTPASAGGTALLARFVYRHRVTAPAAAATVALIYTTSAFGSCVTVAVAALATGRGISVGTGLSAPVLAAVASGVTAGALVLRTAAVRRRLPVLNRIVTWVRGILHQGAQVVRDPVRMAGGIVAGLVVLLGSAVTLACCVQVYGATVPLIRVVLVLTIGTAIGSATPLPGGVGPVEASLTTGLALSGVDASTALLGVLLYRLLTFWLRVPLGWGCLIWLRRADHV